MGRIVRRRGQGVGHPVGILDDDPGPELGLIVEDLDAMGDFYRRVFDLPLVAERTYPSGTRMLVLRCGAVRLKLNRPSPLPVARVPGGAHRDALGLRYFTIYVRDAQVAYDQLRAQDVDVTSPPRLSPAGKLFFIRDPEGNSIELVQRHPATAAPPAPDRPPQTGAPRAAGP